MQKLFSNKSLSFETSSVSEAKSRWSKAGRSGWWFTEGTRFGAAGIFVFPLNFNYIQLLSHVAGNSVPNSVNEEAASSEEACLSGFRLFSGLLSLPPGSLTLHTRQAQPGRPFHPQLLHLQARCLEGANELRQIRAALLTQTYRVTGRCHRGCLIKLTDNPKPRLCSSRMIKKKKARVQRSPGRKAPPALCHALPVSPSPELPACG